jgi:hypothetical protein
MRGGGCPPTSSVCNSMEIVSTCYRNPIHRPAVGYQRSGIAYMGNDERAETLYHKATPRVIRPLTLVSDGILLLN